MNKKISMRDAFWDEIYNLAKKDSNLMLVCADMGAPSLDKYRRDFPNQYFNVGISEHNMLAVASGMAKEGKKVFTYAIAPFITSRSHEFVKINGALMKIPINLVGVGAGFGYNDSGPTHHTTEDIAIMRALPNLLVFGPSDSYMASKFAYKSYSSKNPVYIRLDREVLPNLSKKNETFDNGYRIFGTGSKAIVSTGNMVHVALEVQKEIEKEKKDVAIIDLYQLNPIPDGFEKEIKKYDQIISLEEHLLNGGLGSIIAETIVDHNLSTKLKRIGLKDYIYAYGERKDLQKKCEIDSDSVIKVLKNLY